MREKTEPIANSGLHREMIISAALRKEVRRHGPEAVVRNRTGGITFDQLKKNDPLAAERMEPEISKIFACAR